MPKTPENGHSAKSQPSSTQTNTSVEAPEIENETDNSLARLHLPGNKLPFINSPGDVLRLQRQIGNQAVMRILALQTGSAKPATIQRHPSHAEEEEVERVIARHPSHAEEEEVDRVIERRPSPENKPGRDNMHLRQTVSRRELNPERRGMRPDIQRTYGSRTKTAVMREVPTTDQLNQKFKRTDKARHTIYVENLTLMVQALAIGATTKAAEILKDLSFYGKSMKKINADIEKFQQQGNKEQVIAQLSKGVDNTKKQIASLVIDKKAFAAINKELGDITSELGELGKIASPSAEDLKKLPPIEQKLKDIESKVPAKALTSKASSELSQAKTALGNIDTIVLAGFGSDMRHKVDKVFSALPSAHVGGNASLVSIGYGQKMEGLGQASGYDYEEKSISMVLPDNPITGKPMGEGIFTRLKRSNRLIRAIMDLGASEEYVGVESGKGSLFGSLLKGKRSNFSGQKTKSSPHMGKLANKGTLVNWIIRHEMGHSVDTQIKFTKTRGKIDVFGGWQQYEGDEIKQVVQAMLKGSSLNYNTPLEKGGKELGEVLLDVLSKDHKEALDELKKMQLDAKAPKNASQSGSRAFKIWLKAASKKQLGEIQGAMNWAATALSQPWMLSDGASDKLAVDGRVYQRDHYGTWVSYLKKARANALSSYQFSSPGEWFAEAYAAFYDPSGKSRSALTAPVLEWFKTNLGEAGDKGTATLTKGGTLGTLGDVDDKLSSSSEIKKSKKSDLPEDLQKIIDEI